MARLVIHSALVFATLSCFLAGAPAPAHGQQTGTITGRVVDASTLQPIASAQVFIPSLNTGALTREDGRYILVNIPLGTHTVQAQILGYRSGSAQVTAAAGQAATVDFQLQQDALALDAVVVTGTPGGTQRRAIGNTVAQVQASEITQRTAVTSMQEMLSANTTGLQFGRMSGLVGTGSAIQIRSVGSFNLGTQPLIFIDGVRMDNSTRMGPKTSVGPEVSVLDDINPQDIESIEIIKGPAAATLYGTEASAGVIQIITKRGAIGAPQFDLSIRQGANYMPDPVGRMGPKWACATRGAPPCPSRDDIFKFNYIEEQNKYLTGMVPGPNPDKYDGRFYPWPHENIWTYGRAQEYNLEVRGGSEAVRYYVSGNWQDDVGAIWYNWDKTGRMRANVSAVLTDNLSLDVSTGYLQGKSRLADPTQNEGGTWVDMMWGNGYELLRKNPHVDPRRGELQDRRPDDVADIEVLRDYRRFTGSATLNHRFGGIFSQRLVTGIDTGWELDEVIYPIETEGATYNQTAAGEHDYKKPVTTNVTLDYAITADYRPNTSWSFATSFGAQYYAESFEEIDMTGFKYASILSRSIDQTNLSRIRLNHSLIENKSLGVFVQEQVGLNERLFVTAAVRFDDNSAFGANFDAQMYPKLAATWVVSEEPFFPVAFFDQLRLRGAVGTAGRQPDTFARSYIYTTVAGPGGSTMFNPMKPGNADVGPEVSTEYEAGFDVALMDQRVSGEFTYFYQKNENALLGLPLVPSIGFPGTVDQNVGRIDAWGWEANLNLNVYQSPTLAFDLALSGDHNYNEIKDIGEFPGTPEIAIGLPYPNWVNYSHVVSAEWDPNGPIANAYGQRVNGLCDAGRRLGPSDKYGKVPGGELVPCVGEGQGARLVTGPGYYPYTWSVAPTLRLGGNVLELFAVAQGQYGKVGGKTLERWTTNYNNSLLANTEDDPLWVMMDRMNDERGKSYTDQSFWKLRDVGFRWNLPDHLVNRVGASRASLAFSGRNMFVLWRRQPTDMWGTQIADPEHVAPNTPHNNAYRQPPISNFNFTLRASF